MADNFDIMKQIYDTNNTETEKNIEEKEDTTPPYEDEGVANKILDNTNKLKNNKKLKYTAIGAFIVILLFLLSFKYELVASGNNVYRLNKITGQVQQIKGTRFIEIDKILNVKLSKITQLKTWDDLTIGSKKIKVSTKTIWRDGRLYYQIKLSQAKIINEII